MNNKRLDQYGNPIPSLVAIPLMSDLIQWIPEHNIVIRVIDNSDWYEIDNLLAIPASWSTKQNQR